MVQSNMRAFLFLLFLPMLLLTVTNRPAVAAARTTSRSDPAKQNIHAIIVSSSRYWFNYRHAINALGIYEIYRQNGIPDENIILMIADEYAINPRNPYKNRMHAEGIDRTGWYNNQTEIDYRGSDVTVQTFMDSLLGTAPKALKNLNEDSNLMIYITGHGGNQFFKFQDEEELTAQDIANLMDKLYAEKKFAKALFIADTCQAFTLFDKVTTPNVMALGTSLIDESAYAHHNDNDLGLAVIERWTHYFIKNYKKHTNQLTTLYQTMVSPFANKRILMARVGIKDDTSRNTFKHTKLSDFFGTKGGAKSWRGKPEPRETIVGVSTENLLKLPSLNQDATSMDEQHPTQSLASDTCSTKSNGILNGLDNGLYAFICCLVVILVLSKKLEKRFLFSNRSNI